MGMCREQDAVSSPVHLGVDTPAAELLHCTIAVNSLGGAGSSQLYLNDIHGKYVIHGQTLHQHTVTSMSQDNAHHLLRHLVLKLQVISALPSFSSSVHCRSHKSSSVVSLGLTYCSQSSWSWSSGLPFSKSLLTHVPSSRRPPFHPGSQSTDKPLLCSTLNPSLLSPKPLVVTIVDRIRPTC